MNNAEETVTIARKTTREGVTLLEVTSSLGDENGKKTAVLLDEALRMVRSQDWSKNQATSLDRDKWRRIQMA